MPDPRSTQAWRQLSIQVRQEEPICWLQYPGICTGLSDTADHIIPIDDRPDLAFSRANCRGACRACNSKRSARGDREGETVATAPALDYFL